MKITLEFDDKKASDNFFAWWLDGGGEQGLGFNTTHWDHSKGYLRIEGSGEDYNCAQHDEGV